MAVPRHLQHSTRSVPIRGSLPSPAVIGLRCSRSGAYHALRGPRTTVGSSAECDIQISDEFVSSCHFLLERCGKRTLLRDSGSKNGTSIDGCPVRVAELAAGQRITLGNTTLTVQAEEMATSSRAIDVLVGSDPAFRRAVELAARAARVDQPVLLLGETGTGKELFARLIHEESRRSKSAYVPLNCGGIAHNLISSELFGCVKGAFTGADGDRLGVFAAAHGGTLFLDEIGELPAPTQPALLRALETGFIRPVGAELERLLDVRIVAATNRLDLQARSSGFRSDLYHRLAIAVITIPPLRDRRGDIPALLDAFLDQLSDRYGRRELPPAVRAQFSGHAWPGNVRELRNTVERLLSLTPRELQSVEVFPAAATAALAVPSRASEARGEGYNESIRGALLASYRRHGSIRKAARALGIPKSTFADRARRLGLDIGASRS